MNHPESQVSSQVANTANVPTPDPTCYPGDAHALSPAPTPSGISSVLSNSLPITTTQPSLSNPVFLLLNQEECTTHASSPSRMASSNFKFLSATCYSTFPNPQKTRSIIYDHGVCVTSENATDRDLWYFLASAGGSEIIKSTRNTSNESDHVQKVHGITSKRVQNLRKRKIEKRVWPSYEHQVMLHTNPNRLHEINFVKLIIRKMLPFKFGECAEHRTFISLLDQNGSFGNEIHSKKVKKEILDMYQATFAKIKKYLHDFINDSVLPILLVNLDLWTCSTTHEKYIGIRICFVSNQWLTRSCLLAVRLFSPVAGLDDMPPDTLNRWCEKVFNEFGIETTDLCSATSDSGSDVKRLFCKLLTSHWD